MSDRELTKHQAEALRAAEYIERLAPEQYSQRHWGSPEEGNECGTAACICGWICRMHGRPESDKEFAAGLLGLSNRAAGTLFRASPTHPDYRPTPSDAARVLRHLALHREVKWDLMHDRIPREFQFLTSITVAADAQGRDDLMWILGDDWGVVENEQR